MRRTLLLGTAALVVGLGLFLLDRQLTRVESTWNEMVAATDELRHELEALPSRRQMLWGEPMAGDAAEDYRRARDLTEATAGVEKLARTWIQTSSKQGRAAAEPAREAFATAMSPALVQLRSGAHRSRFGAVPDWSKGLAHKISNLLVERHLANAAVATAMGCAGDDRDLDAVHWLLDAAQFGRDGAHRMMLIEEMIGVAILQVATTEALLERGLLAELDTAAVAALAAGLERLDQDFAVAGRGQRGDTVLAGYHMRRDPKPWGDALDLGALTAWREGFSSRLSIARLQLASIEFARLQCEVAPREFTTAEARLDTARDRYLAEVGPLAEDCSPPSSLATNRREALARIRLLRMLLSLHLGDEPEPLTDPFGGTLHAERREDGSLRAWSDRPGRKPLELVFAPHATPPVTAPR